MLVYLVLLEILVRDGIIKREPLLRVEAGHLLEHVLEQSANWYAIENLPEKAFVLVSQAFVVGVTQFGNPEWLEFHLQHEKRGPRCENIRLHTIVTSNLLVGLLILLPQLRGVVHLTADLVGALNLRRIRRRRVLVEPRGEIKVCDH